MSSPRRVIDADDDFERELIRSAHADKPGEQALQRMLVGLGVGLTGIAGASPVAAGGQLGATALVKWLLSGMALGIATSGGVHVAGRALEHRHDEEPVGSAPGVMRPTPPQPPELALVPSSPAGEPAAGSASAAHAESSPSRVRPSLEPRGVSPGGSPEGQPSAPSSRAFPVESERATPASLAAETRALDAVRRTLAGGQASLALAELASYERTFPSGALRPEASVLKVRALLAAGDRAGADALGKRIIAAAPDSEHADAVRAALGSRTNP